MKFRSRLVVNLQNLKENFEYLYKDSPSCKTLFMVKADGYGHGILPVVRYAHTELGISEFGCATIEEAVYLRRELSDLNFDIYVFSDLQLDNPESVEIYTNERIFPILSSLEHLDFFLHQENFKHFPICLKINTGMNRLGIELSRIQEVIERLLRHNRKSIYHLFTHLANSSYSMEKDVYNLEQQKSFKLVQEKFKNSKIEISSTSISNSGALLQSSGLDQTHIRPGLMLYTHPKCISRLETKILQVFEVKKDTPVGYNSILCPRDGLVAVLAIGYGDGFSTHYSGAHITHQGMPGEIIGRINMDMTFVLFPTKASTIIKPGDVVAIWGENEGDLLKFSDETKTIPYELLCSLLPRIPRIYRLS
jgi:alanine racemase